MAKYDPVELIKLYVFGTSTPFAEDYNLHIRPFRSFPNSSLGMIP
jgi:hypothetical protein